MILYPLLWLYMGCALLVGAVGLVLIGIGKAFRWVLLGTFLFLCTQVSLADEIGWQLVFIVEGELVEHREPFTHKRDCMRLGYMYMQDEITDETKFDGFLCDRVPPREPVAKKIPVCTAPVEQCS